MHSAISIREDIRIQLKDKIRYAFEESLFSEKIIYRIELPIQSINMIAWLSNQRSETRLFWSSRDKDFETAGIGLAYGLQGTRFIDIDAVFHELNKYLVGDTHGLKFFGGFAFSPEALDHHWENFGSYRFILPKFEILRRENNFYLACNLFGNSSHPKRLEETLAELDRIDFDDTFKDTVMTNAKHRIDEPGKEAWNESVGQALGDIQDKKIDKVVLARRSTFEFENEIHSLMLFSKLKNLSEDCYHFYFEPYSNQVFLGASPERLYKRIGKTILTEAIAGTRPRGTTPSSDESLRNDLLKSAKDRHEHLFVAEAIKESLNPICKELAQEKTLEALSLSGGHHLLTSFKGNIAKNITDTDIFTALHPTPATGGWPTPKALKLISKLEPFKRGWYTGAIGFVGQNECDFAVGIRCGLIVKNKLFLYAGAGIVEGSNAEGEWEEIETKIGNFLRIFEK